MSVLTEQPRIVPQSLQAEQAVLGCLLVDSQRLHEVPGLQASDFLEPVHQRIFRAIERRVVRGERADALTLQPVFEDDPALKDAEGARYLAHLSFGAETILSVVPYADQVCELARRRELMALADRLLVAAQSTANDRIAAEILAGEQRTIDSIITGSARSSGAELPEVLTQMIDLTGKELPRFMTEIPALDAQFGGGVPLGRVLGFEARPKSGKSIALTTLALRAAQQGYRTVYFALEMGAQRLAARVAGTVGAFNSGAVSRRDREAERLLRQALPKAPRGFVIEDQAGITYTRLRTLVARHIRHGAKVVALDYYQLVRPTDRRQNRSEFLDELAQWCAEQAKQHEVCFLVAAQSNREGFTRGSDGLAMACDWHCQMHKCEERRSIGGQLREALWLDVSYNRDGPADSIGSEEQPLLYIDWHGPSLAQMPGTHGDDY